MVFRLVLLFAIIVLLIIVFCRMFLDEREKHLVSFKGKVIRKGETKLLYCDEYIYDFRELEKDYPYYVVVYDGVKSYYYVYNDPKMKFEFGMYGKFYVEGKILKRFERIIEDKK